MFDFNGKKIKEDVRRVTEYLDMVSRYENLSRTLRIVVITMAEIYYSKDSTEDEKAAALFTIVEAFFPEIPKQ